MSDYDSDGDEDFLSDLYLTEYSVSVAILLHLATSFIVHIYNTRLFYNGKGNCINSTRTRPIHEISSTNNVDNMTKASLVDRNKRSNSDMSVDGLALLNKMLVLILTRQH